MPYVPHAQLSHVGITVIDLDRMVDFYTRVLGFTISDRGRPANGGNEFCFMSRDPTEHHQLVFVEGRPPDAPSQIAQLSLKMGSLAEMRTMYGILRAENEVTDISTRAHGIAWSLYFKDPESNVVETFTPTPWYVPAPTAIPFSFDDMTDGEIFETVREQARARPGFKTYDEWRAEARERMLEGGNWPGSLA